MDRELLDALNQTRRQVKLDTQKAFLDGWAAGVMAMADAYDEGRLDDELVRLVRDHIALHREHSS